MRSVGYTLVRDITFGVIYTMISPKLNPEKNFLKDIIIASSATIASSPINYFRNRILISPINKSPTPSTIEIWKELIEDVRTKPNKLSYVLGNRFCIGRGTLRVGRRSNL